MRTEKIICDGCGNDLTTGVNAIDYRLELRAETMPLRKETFQTGTLISSPLERTHHFCRLDCLDRWRHQTREGDV